MALMIAKAPGLMALTPTSLRNLRALLKMTSLRR